MANCFEECEEGEQGDEQGIVERWERVAKELKLPLSERDFTGNFSRNAFAQTLIDMQSQKYEQWDGVKGDSYPKQFEKRQGDVKRINDDGLRAEKYVNEEQFNKKY